MQRRAAAIYFVFFLVVGAAAYAYIGVAQSTQQPEFDVDGTTLQGNESTTIDGTQYTIAELGHASGGGGGHGGGGGEGALVATLEWTNESAVQTATIENGSSVTLQNASYTVAIPNGSNVSSFTLREEQNVSAILANDPAVKNSLATQNDTDYVVFRENNSLRPAAEYLPAPETRQFATGDRFRYEGTRTTVADVSSGSITLEWTGPVDNSVDLQEGTNVTLANGDTFFAHFPNEEAVSLVPVEQYDQYESTVSQRGYFDERVNGLWGVVIIAWSAAFLVLSMAYLPHRG